MIRVPEVRLISADGEQLGIVSLEDALRKAQDLHLDLVEVAPMAKPPVCKIIDYGKVIFDSRQRKKAQKRKQRQMEIKEVKMKLKIDTHDYETKLRRAVKFLKDGDKVKFTIIFRGREVTHQEIGRALEDRIVEDLSQIAEVEGMMNRTGRFHSFLMARRKDYKLDPGDETNHDEEDEMTDETREKPTSSKPRKSKDALSGGEETAILPS